VSILALHDNAARAALEKFRLEQTEQVLAAELP
jgi:hypothetical protein